MTISCKHYLISRDWRARIVGFFLVWKIRIPVFKPWIYYYYLIRDPLEKVVVQLDLEAIWIIIWEKVNPFECMLSLTSVFFLRNDREQKYNCNLKCIHVLLKPLINLLAQDPWKRSCNRTWIYLNDYNKSSNP
jgi:hypothetical protein